MPLIEILFWCSIKRKEEIVFTQVLSYHQNIIELVIRYDLYDWITELEEEFEVEMEDFGFEILTK